MESFDDVRARELAHRFKNILTITRSIVSQSLRTATSIEEARSVVDERLPRLAARWTCCLRPIGSPLCSKRWRVAP